MTERFMLMIIMFACLPQALKNILALIEYLSGVN